MNGQGSMGLNSCSHISDMISGTVEATWRSRSTNKNSPNFCSGREGR